MKRMIIAAAVLITALVVVIIFTEHIDMPLHLKINGGVDKISIFMADDDSLPVVSIETKGADVDTKIKLNTGYQYYFIAYKGEKSVKSREIGFSTRQLSATLVVDDISSYTIMSKDQNN